MVKLCDGMARESGGVWICSYMTTQWCDGEHFLRGKLGANVSKKLLTGGLPSIGVGFLPLRLAPPRHAFGDKMQ